MYYTERAGCPSYKDINNYNHNDTDNDNNNYYY